MTATITVINTTVSTDDQATTIGAALIEQRLAACVQIQSIGSVYRWDGEIKGDAELRLDIKTTQEAVDPLLAFLAAEHPYDVPAIIVHKDVETTPDYASWVASEVSPAG